MLFRSDPKNNVIQTGSAVEDLANPGFFDIDWDIPADAPLSRDDDHWRVDWAFIDANNNTVVYSEAFDAIPEVAKSRLYARIDDVLSGREQSAEYAHLDADTRTAIRDILMQTKADFAAAVQ